MESIILESLKKSIAAKEGLVNSRMDDIIRLANAITDTLSGGGKLLIFGNGGSAADAQHMAAEFVNRFLIDRPPLAAIALTTDSSVLTSVGNDFAFDEVFAKQILALGKKSDLALGITTSGNSANVIKAVEAAREIGMKTAVLTGGSGGKVLTIADMAINVPADDTPAIQEAHLWVEHLLCQLVDEALFGKTKKG